MKKIKTYILIMMLSLIINIDKINALEVEITDKINSQNTLKECEYSDAYIKWLSLSEEEKQKTIEPFKCKINKKKSLISNIISNSLKGDTSYPDSYSLKDEGEDTPVKNQKETGSCWTFGTTSVIETHMKKKHSIDVDLSERHIEYMTSRTFLNGEINPFGYNREIDDGGNFFIASGYLMHGHGPIAEEDMPFESPAEKIELSELEGKEQVIDVNSITINAGSDCASISPFIKSHLMENGALTANVYMTTETAYYNSTTNAMYYNGDETINHAITIVGWDDNY